MSRIKWDEDGKRLYETGVDQCVLYLLNEQGKYFKGVPWNGVTSISESPSGAEANPLYADNTKYLVLRSAEDYASTIEAYMYPDEFSACNGEKELVPGVKIRQQSRSTFGLSYRTRIGNDKDGDQYGYKIHLVYNASAAPSEMQYQTVNESPEAITMSWELSTIPVNIPGSRPSATIVIDSTVVSAKALKAIEDTLYGTEGKEPTLPLPDELIDIINSANTTTPTSLG